MQCVGNEQSIPAVGESLRVCDLRFRCPQNTLDPPIQSNGQQSTQFLRQADVQVLLLVVVPHIISFVHASPPQASTAVHAYAYPRLVWSLSELLVGQVACASFRLVKLYLSMSTI